MPIQKRIPIIAMMAHALEGYRERCIEAGLDDFEGDRDLLLEAMDLFLGSVSNQIGTLRQAILDDDAEIVRKEAHSIKGGAANLSADVLSEIAFELENAGKPKAIGTSTGILGRLEEEFDRLNAYAKDR